MMLYTELQNINLGIRTPHNIHLQVIFDLECWGCAHFNELHLSGLRWHTSGNYGEAFAAWLVVSLVLAGSLFNFVIWRT